MCIEDYASALKAITPPFLPYPPIRKKKVFRTEVIDKKKLNVLAPYFFVQICFESPPPLAKK